MAKSAVRAMDAIQELIGQRRSGNIKGFIVFGGSKRGWTSWMTAATKDNRVAAIAPMVINTLNMQPQYIYQLANWGYYSEQIADYYSKNLLVEQVAPNASKEEKELRDQLWQMSIPIFIGSG
jgi:PhoPQ-activated pathogenicity-related protein